MKRGDIGSALALIALGLFVIYQTSGYPDSMTPGAPGPAFFPRLLAGLLLFLSLLLVVGAVRSKDTAARPAGAPWSRAVRSGATLALAVVFLLTVEQADFFLLLLPLLAGVMAVMGERSLKVLTLVPLAFVAFVYVVFFHLFGVPFPTIL